MLTLLACTTTSYVDRIAISVLAPTLRDEFGMTNSEYAFVVNCFMVTYMIMYSVGGRLADLLGFRKALSLYIVWWSLSGSLHALSTGFRSLAGYRFLLQWAREASWPASMKAAAHQVQGPLKSLAVGTVNFGSSLGSALAVPLVGWLTVLYGWRIAFLATGLMGFLLLPFWLSVTRDASHAASAAAVKVVSPISWLNVVRYRQAWAPFIGRLISAGAWGFYRFLDPRVPDSRSRSRSSRNRSHGLDAVPRLGAGRLVRIGSHVLADRQGLVRQSRAENRVLYRRHAGRDRRGYGVRA